MTRPTGVGRKESWDTTKALEDRGVRLGVTVQATTQCIRDPTQGAAPSKLVLIYLAPPFIAPPRLIHPFIYPSRARSARSKSGPPSSLCQ